MDNTPLSIFAAAAQHLVVGTPTSRCCTWRTTRWDDDFDLSSTLRYLRAEGDDPDELLLQRYAALHEQHITIDLAGIGKQASWIELLEDEFVDYASFRHIRETNAYSTIVTFTTPAISDSKDLAFLELWTEDGRYAQMGCWWWLQMRLTSRGWNVDWKNMHAMS
ncbi:MAG: hypothetical protein JNK90_22100 [Planctomycetaceae bacterium]|nr:hypothetical protein [Planctomycetaceae bacterium]MBN8599831.1 hypothetical protein [Planctomycetota bacterium]